MGLLKRVAVRWRAIARRTATEQGLDEELQYHLAREIERNVANGMTPDDAEIAARRAFGNVGVHKDAMRDSWGVGWLERLMQDLRYAARSFRRTPAFVSTVAATIGLGLGLVTTVFTIFNAYVLRPIAVREPHRLHEFVWLDRGRQSHRLTLPQYEVVRRDDRVFSDAVAYRSVMTRYDNRPAHAQLVSGNYFDMLGTQMMLGRPLTAPDLVWPFGGATAVLHYDFWRTRLGADSSVLGKRLSIRGYPVTVVGVAERSFGGLSDYPPDFWLPMTMLPLIEPEVSFADGAALRVVGRLRDGVTRNDAQALLGEWARRETAGLSEHNRAVGAMVIPRATAIALTPEILAVTAPVIVAFGLVLLIACANVANMMLARGMARQREIGIRLALGASRGRLVRQLMTESMLLAIPAGLLAFGISRLTLDGGFRLLLSSLPAEFGQYLRVIPLLPDARVLAFVLSIALISAVAFGLAPAIQATRPSVVQATRGDFDTPFRPARLRHSLVIAQVTICVLLLVCAGVLLRTSKRLQRLDVGITTRDAIQINLGDQSRSQIVDAVRRMPIVRDIAAATAEPLDARFPSTMVRAEGGRMAGASYTIVSGSYFRVLGIPLRRGRAFLPDEERTRSPVVIVSEGTAHALWPGRDPLGQLLTIADDSLATPTRGLAPYRTARVIGVARNAVPGWIGIDMNEPVVYYPSPIDAPQTHLLAQVIGDTERARQSLTERLTPAFGSTIREIHRLEDYRAVQVYPFRAVHWVSSALGVIALLLTLTGIYGVIAYAVAQRTKEIGIRMALGASASTVVAMVLKQSLRLAAIGIGIGVVLALAASSFFASRVQMMDAFDVMGYAGGVALVLVASVAAAYVPSRRAATINPLHALRHD
jgi:predicted permease